MRYVLPVSAEQRESWGHSLPEGYQNAGDDYVTYHAKPGEGKEPNSPHRACYARLRPNYENFEIVCYPCKKPGVISFEDAIQFLDTMISYGIVPEGVLLWEEDNGIRWRIPKGCGNPHNIYAALTCYRWIDAHPPLVWEFLRIMSENVLRHPLQILPYLISKNISNHNHSFITTAGWVVELTAFEIPTNPVLGLAAKIYFDQEDKRGQKNYGDPNTYVNTTVGEISKELAPSIETPSNKNYGPKTISTLKYALEQPVDGLHPDLYELYTVPNITPTQVEKILEGLFTKEV